MLTSSNLNSTLFLTFRLRRGLHKTFAASAVAVAPGHDLRDGAVLALLQRLPPGHQWLRPISGGDLFVERNGTIKWWGNIGEYIYIYDYTYSVINIGHGFNICMYIYIYTYIYIMGYVSDIVEM